MKTESGRLEDMEWRIRTAALALSPSPAVVTRRARASSSPPSRQRSATGLGDRWKVPTAAAAVAAALWLVAYFVPVSISPVLAESDTTGAAWVLQRVGLASQDLTSGPRDAVDRGVRVSVHGIYSDAFRTVVVLQSSAGTVEPASVVLTDQFGSRYPARHSVADSRTGDQAMTFAPFGALVSATGARAHVHASKVIDGAAVTAGSWDFDGFVIPASRHDLANPAAGMLGANRISFVSASLAGSTLEIVLRSSQPFGYTAKDSGSGPDGLGLRLVGRNYDRQPLVMDSELDSEGMTHTVCLWVAVAPGSYQLTISGAGAQPLDRTIVIKT